MKKIYNKLKFLFLPRIPANLSGFRIYGIDFRYEVAPIKSINDLKITTARIFVKVPEYPDSMEAILVEACLIIAASIQQKTGNEFITCNKHNFVRDYNEIKEYELFLDDGLD